MIILQLFAALIIRFSPGKAFDRSLGILAAHGLDANLKNQSWKQFEKKIAKLSAWEISLILDELCHTKRYDEEVRMYLDRSDSEIRNFIAGVYHIFLAWESRTANWAKHVTEEQAQGFFDHLQQSHDLLSMPYTDATLALVARSQLISVAMGFGEREYVEELYRQCMEMDPRYFPAKNKYFWAISTRWLSNGDSEPMRRFALEEDHGELQELVGLMYWLQVYQDYYYWNRDTGIEEDEARNLFRKEHKEGYMSLLQTLEVPADSSLPSIFLRNYLACVYTTLEKTKERNKTIKSLGGKYLYWPWNNVGIETAKQLRWYKIANML